MKKLTILATIITTIWVGVLIWGITLGIKFDQNCSGYLQQAADANTIELAIDRLDKAIEYAEEKGLDVSKITDEEIDKVFREQTLLYGYTDLSLDGVESDYDMSFDKDSIEAVKKSYIDEGKLNTLLSSYDKTTLEYDSTENGVVKAFYNVEGFESSIVVGVDESTKELVSLSFV